MRVSWQTALLLVLSAASVAGVQVFGITYSGFDAQGCKSYAQVERDMKALAGQAAMVRIYGTSCNQASHALQAIVQNNLPLRVMLGVWLRANPQEEIEQLVRAVEAHRSSRPRLIAGVLVGNEEGLSGQVTPEELVARILQVKARLRHIGAQSLPVSTAELDSQWTPALASHVDFIGVQVQPFFQAGPGVSGPQQTVGAALDGALARLGALRQRLADWGLQKDVVVTEIGWPSASSAARSDACLDCAQRFVGGIACRLLETETPYFLFEAFDSLWKEPGPLGVERHFGLLGADGSPKIRLDGRCGRAARQ